MNRLVLVVDGDIDTRESLCANLTRLGYDARSIGRGDQALALLQDGGVDAIITDIQTGGLTGTQLCARARQGWPDVPVIVLTRQTDAATVVAALRAGAHDFISKPVDRPIDMDEVAHRLQRALAKVELVREVRQLRRRLHVAPPTGIIGESPALKRTLGVVARVADTDVPVLVTGESGVGKELIARELHRQSRREAEPFVAINCAAIPSQLLESELFGHVRGAFTGARASRGGLFVEAGRGILFLDEIAELPIEMQPKLLRALQERQVRPVGSDRTVECHARVITATNRDLEAEVERGRFREDLFYRVNVVNVDIPPLRERGNDVLLLAQFFLARVAARNGGAGQQIRRISAPAAAKLLAYDWPGNVRELENCIERAVALAGYDELMVADLPARVSNCDDNCDEVGPAAPEQLMTLSELEARYIKQVVRAVNGNKTRAAEILGLARRTLYRRLDRLESAR